MMWVLPSSRTICKQERMTRITVRLRSAVAVSSARRVCAGANKRAIYTHERERSRTSEMILLRRMDDGARARTTVSATFPSHQRVDLRDRNIIMLMSDDDIGTPVCVCVRQEGAAPPPKISNALSSKLLRAVTYPCWIFYA